MRSGLLERCIEGITAAAAEFPCCCRRARMMQRRAANVTTFLFDDGGRDGGDGRKMATMVSYCDGHDEVTYTVVTT